MFIGFTNFYRHFIQGFNKIAAPLTSILKTSYQLASALLATSVDNNEVVGTSGGNNKKSAKSDFTKLVCGAEKSSLLTPNAKQVFIQLRQVFTKVQILQHFDLKYHIQIETNISGYAIGSIPSQMTLETG